MAYQGLGSESWTGYTDSIPKTRPGYFLADLHAGYSYEQNKEDRSAAKGSAQAATAQVPRSQADSNAGRPDSVTDTDGTGSSTDVQTSSASDDVALPEVVSPTARDVSVLEISPRLMSSEYASG